MGSKRSYGLDTMADKNLAKPLSRQERTMLKRSDDTR